MMKHKALYMAEMPINKGIEGNHVGMYRENENFWRRKFICSENGYYHLAKTACLMLSKMWEYSKERQISEID